MWTGGDGEDGRPRSWTAAEAGQQCSDAVRSAPMTSSRPPQVWWTGGARRTSAQKGKMVQIAIGSDHAGFVLKQHLVALLRSQGHEVTDHGTDSEESVDYPGICA